jgi:hypothetical protein
LGVLYLLVNLFVRDMDLWIVAERGGLTAAAAIGPAALMGQELEESHVLVRDGELRFWRVDDLGCKLISLEIASLWKTISEVCYEGHPHRSP